MNKHPGSASGVFDDIALPNRKAGRRKAMLFGVSVIAATIAGVGVWAGSAPLSSAVISQGQIVVSSKRKQVQHREGGTVRKINVRDGENVSAGDTLIELDNTEAHLHYSLTRAAYFSALTTKHRLMSEKDDIDKIAFPVEIVEAAKKNVTIANLLNNQRHVFIARRTERDGQIIVLRQRIAQTEEEVRGYEAELAAYKKQNRIAGTELELLRKLLKNGYTTRTRVASLERENAQLVGSKGKITAQIARAKANIGEAKLQILQITKQFRAETFKELKEIEERIYGLREKFENASKKLERLRIRAPSDGEIVNMKLSTVGGVIQPGETILEIVPKDDRLIIEARIRPVDIDQISAGLETESRITAFQQRTMSTLHGRVSLVSADALTDDRTGQPYFVAHIEVLKNDRTLDAVNRLHPGMPAEVMIKTGQRTLINYLIQPIKDSINRALRER